MISTGGQIQYATNPASGVTTFSSTSDTNLDGNVTTTSNGRIQVTYDEVSSINLNVGSNNYPLLNGLAYFFLEFGQGQPWTPTTLYVPKLDLDGNNSSGATGANYQTSFTENGTAVAIADTDTIITDADDTKIESATITLTNRPNGASESLSVLGTLPTGITASAYDPARGVITLSGSATLVNYQAAIRAITFNNTSENPSTTARSLSVVVRDGDFNSNAATTTIKVTAVNDPPVIDLNGGTTGINYSATFTENLGAVNVANSSTADAADAENNITNLSIAVAGSNADVATETVIIGGQSFLLNANKTVTASVGGTTLSLAYTASSRTFAITNSAGGTTPIPEANLDTLLRGITYNNSSENPTTGDRTFSFTATDANNATSTPAAVSTINVVPVNDAPVLDLDANDSSTAIGANYQTTFTENGTAVSIGDLDTTITDLDNTNIASAAIALTNPLTGDRLLVGGTAVAIGNSGTINGINYNVTAGTGSKIAIALTGSATLANYQTAIRAITFENTSDNPSTTPRTVNVTVNDGTVNSNTATTTINVNPVNDPPVLDLDDNNSSTATGANYQTTFTENGAGVSIGDSDISITDLDNTNIASATITLTNAQASDILAAGTLPTGITASAYGPATGVITLTGSATLANYQDAIRAITFNNTSDNPSTTPRSVSVVVNDGTSNSNTATTTINVAAVNDPPVLDLDANNSSTANGANYQTTFTENGAGVSISDSDISITDLDNTNIASATIALTTAQASDLLAAETLLTGITASAYDTGTGVITLTGSASLADYQTAIEAITFNNTSDNPSTTPRTVTVVVNDGSSNSNTATTTINVTAVNDAPTLDLDANNSSGATGANYQTTFTENGAPVNIADVLDADASDAENNITSLEIVVGNVSDGAAEIITLAGQTIVPNADQTLTGVSVGNSTIDIAYVATGGAFTITNNAGGTTPIAQSDLDTLLQSITYENQSENPTAGDRTFTFSATDANGATSNSAISTIVVTAINDPAVLDLDSNNSSGATGNNYQTTFTEGCGSVSIGNTDTLISDVDDTNIESTTITLTNTQANDLLAAASLPTGISASAYNSTTEVITLSGSASLADYQAAIKAISFENTSSNPNTSDRILEVVVNNGDNASNTATSTIQVFNRIDGTSGSDDLTDEFTPGNDLIVGYEGQDTLSGGAGNDRFFYTQTSDGIDIITDFDATDGDKLVFSDIINGELNGIAFSANAFDDGYIEAVAYGTTGVMIQVDVNPDDSLENKNVVLLKNDLEGISFSDIDASDFIF